MNYNILNEIANKVKTNVYVVFDTHSNSRDGRIIFEIRSIHNTLEGAYKSAKELTNQEHYYMSYERIHVDMDYQCIYIGKRSECDKFANPYDTHCGCIIEEMNVEV